MGFKRPPVRIQIDNPLREAERAVRRAVPRVRVPNPGREVERAVRQAVPRVRVPNPARDVERAVRQAVPRVRVPNPAREVERAARRVVHVPNMQQAAGRAVRQVMNAPRPRHAMPVSGGRPAPQGYAAPPRLAPPPARLPSRSLPQQGSSPATRAILWLAIVALAMGMLVCAVVTGGVGLVYTSGILPGVRSGGVALGGLSPEEAEPVLAAGWNTITIRDGQRATQMFPSALGLTLDTRSTAQAAYDVGRADLGSALPGLLGGVTVPPVVRVDPAAALAGLEQVAAQFNQPAVNAGVRFANGQVEATAPVMGRALDTAATLRLLESDPGGLLADGMLEVVMREVQPEVIDATPMLDAARRLLSSPLNIRVYDPITGDSVYWSPAPETWSAWLTAAPDASSPTGLALTADPTPTRAYLSNQAATVLDASRYLNLDEAAAAVGTSISRGQTTPTVRVYHHDRQHVVQPGESIISIAWDYGVPYLFIQQANGGLSSVSAGQTITIPTPDTFLLYPVVPDKRIEVSISQQRVRVYENGALKWDWIASTGIADSPTWPGVYQVISHEPNAYAGNWNLWMPNFLGVYQPIPGSSFTNGFHGFPTRGNSQLLWTNSLGTRVTYGCILLSNENAQLLYNWAEEGVVVEIQA